MLKNYLKIALRNLQQHKGYTFINVSGLAIGMACCMLIFMLVRHEWSYDAFHDHAEDIYKVVIQETRPDGSLDAEDFCHAVETTRRSLSSSPSPSWPAIQAQRSTTPAPW